MIKGKHRVCFSRKLNFEQWGWATWFAKHVLNAILPRSFVERGRINTERSFMKYQAANPRILRCNTILSIRDCYGYFVSPKFCHSESYCSFNGLFSRHRYVCFPGFPTANAPVIIPGRHCIGKRAVGLEVYLTFVLFLNPLLLRWSIVTDVRRVIAATRCVWYPGK